MEVHEVRILRKGCKGENKSRVFVSSEELTLEQQRLFVNDFSEEQIVFASKSEKADIKASFYFHGEKMRICCMGITAIVQVLTKYGLIKYMDKKVTIETDKGIVEIDMLVSAFSKKEYNIMNHTKKSLDRQSHYWAHSVRELDGYNSDTILMEVPKAPLRPLNALNTEGILNSSLVHYTELNDFLEETLSIINKPKYRMHVKFENDSFNDMFLTLYIQDLERGQMIRLEYFAEYERQLDLAKL